MSNIKPFAGIEIPFELEDLLTPLLPFLMGWREDISMNGSKEVRLEFYFPVNTIQYDAEMMKKFFHSITVEIDRTQPVYSWTDLLNPIIPASRRGERVTCDFTIKPNDNSRTKKSTRTTERSEESTSDSFENFKSGPELPPQRFA